MASVATAWQKIFEMLNFAIFGKKTKKKSEIIIMLLRKIENYDRAILYYQTLSKEFKVDSATNIKDSLEKVQTTYISILKDVLQSEID